MILMLMNMVSPYNFIVYTENRYNNVAKVGDRELVLNTDISVKDFVFTNRVAKVLAVPSAFETPVQVGDDIIVHHNVFRRWYDVKGNEKEASGFLEDNHFMVGYDEMYAYKHNGQWLALDGYVFIKPVPPESIWNTTGETLLKGVLVHPSKELEYLRGHVVGFTPESEYEFNIEGERIYRVFAHHITVDYGICETGAAEDNKVLEESS